MKGLETGRIQVASRALGVATAALEDALAYAQERESFGQPIWKHQSVGNYLADMATKLTAARQLTRYAAERYDSGERCDMEAGMAKLFASEVAMEIALNAVRIHGGYGYSTEYDVERYFRDAPLMIVGEGTNEIQRNVIAGAAGGPRRDLMRTAPASACASSLRLISPGGSSSDGGRHAAESELDGSGHELSGRPYGGSRTWWQGVVYRVPAVARQPRSGRYPQLGSIEDLMSLADDTTGLAGQPDASTAPDNYLGLGDSDARCFVLPARSGSCRSCTPPRCSGLWASGRGTPRPQAGSQQRQEVGRSSARSSGAVAVVIGDRCSCVRHVRGRVVSHPTAIPVPRPPTSY